MPQSSLIGVPVDGRVLAQPRVRGVRVAGVEVAVEQVDHAASVLVMGAMLRGSRHAFTHGADPSRVITVSAALGDEVEAHDAPAPVVSASQSQRWTTASTISSIDSFWSSRITCPASASAPSLITAARGSTVLTRMPRPHSSCASALVSRLSAAFDEPYMPDGGGEALHARTAGPATSLPRWHSTR